MKAWRIRLKNTPLFYTPKKGRFKSNTTNFSTNGKIYMWRKPNIKDCKYLCASDAQCRKYNLKTKDGYLNYITGVTLEIIEYDLIEVTDDRR